MTPRSYAAGRVVRVAPLLTAPLLVALLLASLLSGVGTPVPAAGAQERRVVVIGDSIILGAESALVGAFQGAGWQISFDAAVSRSTVAAALMRSSPGSARRSARRGSM